MSKGGTSGMSGFDERGVCEERESRVFVLYEAGMCEGGKSRISAFDEREVFVRNGNQECLCWMREGCVREEN